MKAPGLEISTKELQRDVDILNAKILEYANLAKKTPQDVLRKKGVDLAFALSKKDSGTLRIFTPAKGFVRASRLALLNAATYTGDRSKGLGVYVRPSIRAHVYASRGVRTRVSDKRTVFGKSKNGVRSIKAPGGDRSKRMNLQAIMVKAELNAREKGRGFLAYAAKLKGIGTIRDGEILKSFDSSWNFLADFGLKTTQDGSTLTIWDHVAAGALQGLSKPAARGLTAIALREVVADMQPYLDRKLAEAKQKAGLS